MSLVNSDRIEQVDNSLAEAFLPRQVKVGTKSIQNQVVYPSRPLSTKDREISFHFGNFGSALIKLDSVRFYVRGRIMAVDGDNVRDIDGPQGFRKRPEGAPPLRDDISIVNNFPHSLFQKAELLCGHNQCKVVVSNYPYRSWLHQVFSQVEDSDVDNGFAVESHFDNDATDVNSPKTLGGIERGMWIKNSRMMEYYFSPCIPLFKLDSLYPSNTPMVLTMTRSPDDFYILSTNDTKYLFVFDRFEIHLDTHELDPLVSGNMEDLMKERDAVFHLEDMTYKHYMLNKETKSKDVYRCFDPIAPNTALFCFVEQEAFFGDTKFNPFAFRTLDLANAKVVLNGKEVVSLDLDEGGGNKTLLYNKFLDFLAADPHETWVTRKLFFHNTALFPLEYNNTCDPGKGTCSEILQTGVYSLHLKFHQPLEKNYLLLVIALHGTELVVTTARHCRFENIFP